MGAGLFVQNVHLCISLRETPEKQEPLTLAPSTALTNIVARLPPQPYQFAGLVHSRHKLF